MNKISDRQVMGFFFILVDLIIVGAWIWTFLQGGFLTFLAIALGVFPLVMVIIFGAVALSLLNE